MKVLRITSVVSFTLALTLSGCAFAPFATEHTALPLGKDNNAIDTGLSPMPYVQYSRGVSSDVDVGAGLEVQFGYSIYGWGKYSFMRPSGKSVGKKNPQKKKDLLNDQGWAFAAVGGGGIGMSVIDTKFLFAGPIGSYRAGQFEYYAHPRLNYLMYDSYSASDNNSTTGFDIEGGSFTYIQLSGGGQYFFTPRFALGLSGLSAPPAPGEPWRVSPGINLLFRF